MRGFYPLPLPVLVLLLVLLLVLPASAFPPGEVGGLYNSYDPAITTTLTGTDVSGFYYSSAETGEVIGNAKFYLGPGQSLNFTLTLADSSTVTGYIRQDPGNLGLSSLQQIGLGSATDSATDYLNFGSDSEYELIYYIGNYTGEIKYYLKLWESGVSPVEVWYELGSPASDNPITTMEITSGTGFDYTIGLCPAANFGSTEKMIEEGTNNSWWTWLVSKLEGIRSLIFLTWDIFSFLFIDHLFLTIGLIEAGMLAYYVNTSSDVFRALSKFIQGNERLFNGIVDFMKNVIEMISYFNPVKWLLGK